MQNLIFLAEGTEPTEGGHAPENPLGFVPVEFALSLVVFGLLLFLIWKFVAPRFEQTFAERTQAIEGGIAAAESKQAEADARLAEL
jgi:F-type H+-transporting ATPase subunit b